MEHIAELAEKLEGLRTEINELEAVEEPTEEQSARMESILPEWDEVKAEHDKLVQRAEKVEAVRSASIQPGNREAGFGAPSVIKRSDPFDDLSDLQWRSDKDPALRDRALSAFEGTKQRGVSDDELAALVENIETIPGAARHALLVGSPAYREAFTEAMRAQGGQPVYTDEQAHAMRAAMSLTGANGGYLLPTLLDPTLIKTGAITKNPIREIATVKTGTVNRWNGVTAGNVTSYWTPEAVTTPEGSPTLGNPGVDAKKLTAWVTGSYEVFEDTGLQSDLPGLIADSFSYMEQTAFITGDGTTAPRGVVTAISATAGSTVTATTRGSFTTASLVDIFALVNSIPTRYEDNVTWLANKAIFNLIRQIPVSAGSSPIWSDYEAALGKPLLGSPIVRASDMGTATTSGSVLAVLGDFSRYVIYDRIGIQVEFVQNLFDQATQLPTGQRGYIAHKRVGGDVVDVNAFRFLKA